MKQYVLKMWVQWQFFSYILKLNREKIMTMKKKMLHVYWNSPKSENDTVMSKKVNIYRNWMYESLGYFFPLDFVIEFPVRTQARKNDIKKANSSILKTGEKNEWVSRFAVEDKLWKLWEQSINVEKKKRKRILSFNSVYVCGRVADRQTGSVSVCLCLCLCVCVCGWVAGMGVPWQLTLPPAHCPPPTN